MHEQWEANVRTHLFISGDIEVVYTRVGDRYCNR